MSNISKFSASTRALWQRRFAEANIEYLDLDYWNTVACAPMKVSPRLKSKLGLDQPTVLDAVCREPVLLAQVIVGHSSGSALNDEFLAHCMETNPSSDCSCMAQDLQSKLADGEMTHDEFLAAVTREFLKSTASKFVGRNPSDVDHDDLLEVVRREQQWMFFFPDAEEFLLACHGRWAMNIISNMWYATEAIFDTRKIHNIPLRNFFQHIITSFKYHARKPKPEPFLKAGELTGVSLDRHLMIGDSIRNDGLAALDAGYGYVVIVHRDGELSDEEIEALPDNMLVVESLMQLFEILPYRG